MLRRNMMLYAALALVLVVVAVPGCGSKATTQPTVAAERQAASATAPVGKASTAAPTQRAIARASTAAPTARAEPSATPAARPSPTVAAPAEDEQAVAFGEIEDLNRFRSYRVVHHVTTDEEKGTQTAVTVTIEYVAEPRAQRMVMATTDEQGELQGAEIIQIGETTYANFGGTWMAMASSDQDPEEQMGWLWNPSEFLTNGEGTYVGRERMNGYDTKHYRYEQSAFSAGGSLTDVEEAWADVWVSTEHNVYVRLITHLLGTDAEKGQVTMDLETNVTDINAPIAILPPEGVDKPGLPEDVPMIEGATEVNILGTMSSFKTTMTVSEVAAFYQEQMAANGWVQGESGGSEEMMSFTKESRSVTIFVSSEDSGSSVTIMVDEGE